MEHGTTILFGLPGVAVDRVERVTGEDGVPARNAISTGRPPAAPSATTRE